MTPYRLHCINDWAPLIIHLALEELGAPYEIVPHDWEAGTLDDPAFRALNPQGLLPVLETPDGPIFETAAILLWLAETHGRLAPAPGSAGRARFLSWFIFVANTLHPAVMSSIYPDRAGGEEAAQAVGRTVQGKLMGHLALLDAEAAARPAWLAPDTPSILSLYLLVLLRWCTTFTADPALNIRLDDFAHLKALVLAQETLPSVLRVAQAEGLGPTPFSAPQISAPQT